MHGLVCPCVECGKEEIALESRFNDALEDIEINVEALFSNFLTDVVEEAISSSGYDGNHRSDLRAHALRVIADEARKLSGDVR